MVSQSSTLFVNLSQDSETQNLSIRGLPDDEGFMRLMNIPAGNKTNDPRPQSSPPSNFSETLSSSIISNVIDEIVNEPVVTINNSDVQARPSKKRKRKIRGKNRPRFALQHPEKLQFNAIGQPVAPAEKVAQFGRFIGQLVRECSNFPLNAKNWAAICKTDKVKEAWITVRVCI